MRHSASMSWSKFIHFPENACENIVCEMAVILSRTQCVKSCRLGNVYMWQWTRFSSFYAIACHQFGAKPASAKCCLFSGINVLIAQQWPTHSAEYNLLIHKWIWDTHITRQIRTPVLRIPPAVTSQAKMKNWLHECQKWVSHMIGHYAHI